MFIRVNLPTMIDGRIQSNPVIAVSEATASRLIKAGVAEPDPELDELKEKARRLGQNADWDKDPKYQRPRAGVVASVTEESFGEKLKRAVERRAAQRGDSAQQAKENAERERSRYRKPQRRQHCKGE
jgi:hypothetical protein